MIFLLARVGKTTQRSFSLMGGILVLPLLLAFLTDNTWLALWLPCLMSNQWLWSDLRFLSIGSTYIPLWAIAGVELILIAVIISLLLHRFLRTAETDIDT